MMDLNIEVIEVQHKQELVFNISKNMQHYLNYATTWKDGVKTLPKILPKVVAVICEN